MYFALESCWEVQVLPGSSTHQPAFHSEALGSSIDMTFSFNMHSRERTRNSSRRTNKRGNRTRVHGNRRLSVIVFLMHLKQKTEILMGFCFPLILQIYEESKMNLEQERPFVCSAPGCSQVSVWMLCILTCRKCFCLALGWHVSWSLRVHWAFFAS